MAPIKTNNNKTEGNKDSSSNKRTDHQPQSKGDIEGLPVYTFGSKNNSETYTKTTEAIGNYVGREYGKAMRILVVKGKEAPPSMPTAPDNPLDTTVAASSAQWRAYDKGLDYYYKQLQLYNERKGKVFIVIMGQCTTTMKNKIEGTATYDDMENGDKVIDLLKLIKELSYATNTIQYPFFTSADQFRRAGTVRQLGHEDLATFYNRWMSQLEVLESQYGVLVPTELVDTNIDKDEAEKHFKACLFLLAVDRKKYGHVLEELNNQYLNGARPYPTSVEGVINMLTHRIDNRTHDDRTRGNNSNNGPPPPPDGDDGTIKKSFNQRPSFHQTQERKSFSQTQTDESDGSEGTTSFSGAPEQRKKIVAWWMKDDE